MEITETKASVHRAIESIPEHLMEILVLRDMQGLSYQEIGQILQAEVGTVKSRISRAREAFKEAYLSANAKGLTEREKR